LLESVRESAIKYSGDIEIIVADAFSKDRTREIALKYGAKVIEGGLPSEGRNAAADEATNEWILFLDAESKLQNADFFRLMMNEVIERKIDFGGFKIEYPRTGNLYKDFFLSLSERISNLTYMYGEKSRKPASQIALFYRTDLVRKFRFKNVHAEEGEIAGRILKETRANYGLIRSPGKVMTSNRRFEREGYFIYPLISSFYCISAYVFDKHVSMERYFKNDLKNEIGDILPTAK
jgi:glycosyltransferase involved in cell wall biosynthesis